MAKGSCSSSAPAAAAAATLPSVDFPVFVDTNLDTHLAMVVTAQDTVADFKRKILDEHPRCFPDLGQITIHAMKVWRRSCFYHLSDAMLVRSAFPGSKRAWFVHLDACSTCSTNNERGPTETFERSENGGQLQKSQLPCLETGPSNLSDGQAVQTSSPAVNRSSVDKNILQPDSNTILVSNFHKATSCDPVANVPSVPEGLSLPQVGSSTVENPSAISNHQDRDASKISTPEANDLNSELGASLHTVKGLGHKVPEDFELVNVRNEVLEMQNPSQDDVMTDQREDVGNEILGMHGPSKDDVLTDQRVDVGSEILEAHNPSKDDVMTDQREDVGNEVLGTLNPSKDDVLNDQREDAGSEVLETHNPSKDDVTTAQREDSLRDKETRAINDEDRSQLTDNYQSKNSSGDLQPEDNSRENMQIKMKKRGKRKENDVIVEPAENPSEDVIADAGHAEGSKIPETDEPDKLSSLDASQETLKPIETLTGVTAASLVGDVDASEMGGSKVESQGDDVAVHAVVSGDKKPKKSRKRRATRLNPSVVGEHENVTGHIAPSASESALPGDDLFGIHQHFAIGKGDNDLPMIKELQTMASEAKGCEDGVDSLKLQEATKATEVSHSGGKKGTKPKGSRALAAKSHALHSSIECDNDTIELASQKSNLHGLDDKNLNSRQHGIGETKEVEYASSQTNKKEALKTSQADSVNGNEVCPAKLDPMSRTDDTSDFKDEKGKRKSKKIQSNAKSFHDPSLVKEHENVTGDIAPSVFVSALTGDDLFGIHEPVAIGKGDNDLPMIKELKTMTSEAKSCEDGVDSLKLPEASEATEMSGSGGKKGTRPKRSRASAAKSRTSHSSVECVNDTIELASQKNLSSRQHGIGETEVEHASSQTNKKEASKTSQADSVNGNDVCPAKLDPMSTTENTLDLKDEKGKRKSKRIRSNAKSFHDPSMELRAGADNTLGDGENYAIHQTDENKKDEALPTNSENKKEDIESPRKRKKLKSDKTCSKNQLAGSMLEEEDNSIKIKSSEPVKTLEPSMELQDGAHSTSGDGENLAIHQTDENRREEALPTNSGNKKEDTAMPRKSKKLKSDKTSSKSQLAGSMLEEEDNGVKSKSSEPVNTPRFESSLNGSLGEANKHEINFKELFVPRAAESGDIAKELAATRKPHERTRKQDRKSNVEDPSFHLEHHWPSSKGEKDKDVHHHDNGTSVVAGDVEKTQPDHRRDHSFAGPNGNKAMKSKIDVASAAHGSSKVSRKTSQQKNNASGAASSVGTDCSEETIYVSKLGKKRPSRSNQYYVAVNKVPDKKLGEVLSKSDGEKSSLATLDSIFGNVSGKSSEDEGGKIDSDATTDISTDYSSSSASSDGEDKRRPSNTPAFKKRAHMESPGTGASIAHGGKNKKIGGSNIALSQSVDTGAKSRSIGMLLRKSSSYRKAKVTAAQSRLEDTDSQPVDMVPDSQVAHDYPEVRLSQ